MQITIFAAGSLGDIQPCLILGKALQDVGFSVNLAAPENFAGLVNEYGLDFSPLGGDVQQIMGSQTGREFMENGSTNPIRSIRAMRAMLGPVALIMAQDGFGACRDAQALISLTIFAPFTKTMADVLDIPLILVEPTPMLPTRAFPAPGWPFQGNHSGLYNWLSGQAMLQVIWQWYSPFVNEFRRSLELPPLGLSSFYKILRSTPLLGAYSPRIIPRPVDWPEQARVTGYWLPDEQAGWQPSPELQAFLDEGDPPVYIGFGSMTGENPEESANVALEALFASEQRGLLMTGWGGLKAMNVPENVYILDAAPHRWLFPRMNVVVHHGGAGTTAEGLRAGIPQVIVPFIVDQPFWGQRLRALGVGPEPIPRKKLTVVKLAEAILAAVNNSRIRLRAASIGEAVREEDGVSLAVHSIQEFLKV